MYRKNQLKNNWVKLLDKKSTSNFGTYLHMPIALKYIYLEVITKVSIHVVASSNIYENYQIWKILLCAVAKIYSNKSNSPQLWFEYYIFGGRNIQLSSQSGLKLET